jgi:GAF domain-containing protein
VAELDLDALLAACADEPIHVPEAVQPFGTAVVVDDGGTVVVRSDDPLGLLGGRAVLGGHLADALGRPAVDRLLGGEHLLEVAGPDGRPLDLVAHPTERGLLVELEPSGATPLASDELLSRQRPLWQARTLSLLLDALVVQVRELTGFDRVMAYRFDPEWNGEVVAEAVDGRLASYLGLRFPASDIPAQARDLYRRNPARLIADVDYRPSPLVHADPTATAPLDLSHSGLRSVSPVHLQYLRNMGVAASMSLSLLVDGELWGLVACHHENGPRRPDPARRRAATGLAELASSLLVTVAEAEALTDRVLASERVGALRGALDGIDDPLGALAAAGPGLLDLVDAAGAVVSLDGRVACVGEVPDPAAVKADVATLLEGRSTSGHADDAVSTDELPAAHGRLVGALAVPVGGGGRSWIAWYRPEMVQEVEWAGDPRSDEVMTGPDGRAHLGPRRSFDTFVESIEGRCRPWTTADRWAATELGSQVATSLTRRTQERLQASQAVQRALLLDTAVTSAGFDVAVRYLPAHGDPVGGDWHDVFHLPDGSTAFVVGDAVGHGLEVAGIMAQLRSALRAYLMASYGPAESLARLDDLVRQLLPGQLATALVCLVEPVDGRFRAASAGHLPPLRLGPTGVGLVEELRGPALGLASPRHPVTVDGVLAPGEGMVLFSDGLVERRGHDVPAALSRLGEALSGADVERSAAVLCDRALQVGTRSDDDDVTVLAFLRRPVGRV